MHNHQPPVKTLPAPQQLSPSAGMDTALIDLVLPGIGSLQFLKHVKRDYPDMEVVMMSSHASLETSIEALWNGAYDFLIKPFDDIEEA
jgi:DNA-binding NtrC family response regulator